MTTPSTTTFKCDPTPPTSPSTGNPTPSTPSHTTRSNDTYVYGVGILAVLAIGVCVFFTYQAKNKKQGNDRLEAQHEQKKQDQPPKQHHIH